MATLGQTPEGLEVRDELPRADPIPLAVWSRKELAPAVSLHMSGALRRLLAAPAHTEALPRRFFLAQGA
jgi:hypothetical protein